jgi:hypothetical protein
MIYCVVPPELEDELYAMLVEHYKDNPNVEVILDRRTGPDPRSGKAPAEGENRRVTRDRRRRRVTGEFPDVDVAGD